MSDFACLIGPDGSGKTSLLEYMKNEMELDFEIVHWSQFKHLAHIPGLPINNDPGVVINSMSTMSRSAMVALITSLLFEAGVKPLVEDGKRVIVDGYYYRFYGPEKQYGVVEDWVYQFMLRLPPPKLTIGLSLSAEQLISRKGVPRRYEYLTTPEDFGQFQNKASQIAQQIASSQSELVILNASGSIRENAESVVKIFQEKLGWFHE